MRLVDADALPVVVGTQKELPTKIVKAIQEAPTIDAVPVVRCKDCTHLLIVTNDPLMGLCQLSAPKTLTMWSEDIATHFCGWGERKVENV